MKESTKSKILARIQHHSLSKQRRKRNRQRRADKQPWVSLPGRSRLLEKEEKKWAMLTG
jgi:hypothetical protein